MAEKNRELQKQLDTDRPVIKGQITKPDTSDLNQIAHKAGWKPKPKP